MRAFFTCMSAKSSIRDLNTISHIHIIVFWISDLDDLVKVSPRAMVYGPDMGVDRVGNKGKSVSRGGCTCSNPEFVKYNLFINGIATIF